MSNILLANISWNPTGWRNAYINPRAGHDYVRQNAGHESLNFKFDKHGIDDDKYVHGYVQWTNTPLKFENGGLIIFYTKNTDTNQGQIVGVYGKAEILDPPQLFRMIGFRDNNYSINIKAEHQFSILFPLPLAANKYKATSNKRIVPQVGFTYKDERLAELILYDELLELSKAGILKSDYNKLVSIYEYYTGKEFKLTYLTPDEKEQQELTNYFKRTKTKEEILKDLIDLKPTDSEEIIVNHKTYKRDNKTIAQIKILRDFKCQICGTSIQKKDGSKYIEAAHIKPKYQRGRETLDNIILLCPNHHKEFDLGDCIIEDHRSDYIDISLNGKRYKLNLTIGQ